MANVYPITGKVWYRESTDEWVLELEGSINDTSFISRHTEPGNTAPEDVPGLPSLYKNVEAEAKLAKAVEALDYCINAPFSGWTIAQGYAGTILAEIKGK